MTRILCNHCSHFFGSWKLILIKGIKEKMCPVCGIIGHCNPNGIKKVVRPSEIIIGFMKEKEMDINTFSKLMRIKVESVSKLLKGKVKIGREIAYRLERVFQVSISFWMNIEKNYQTYLLKSVSD